MKRCLLAVAPLLLTIGAPVFAQQPSSSPENVVETLHGLRVADPFRWLEEKSAPKVQNWTQAQHAHTMNWLNANAPAPAGLRDDLTRYVDRTITSAPIIEKGQTFFTRKRKGEAQAKLYRRADTGDVLVFDPVALDPSGKTSISSYTFSPHDRTAAVGVQRAGSEITDTHFVNRDTGAVAFAPFSGVTGVSFAATPGEVYLTIRNRALIDAQTPLHAYAHTLGKPIAQARRVMENDDAKNWVAVSENDRSRYTLFTRGEFWSRTFTIAPVGSDITKVAPKVLFSSIKAQGTVQIIGDTAYVISNENAPNWKLERAQLSATAVSPLASVLPERKDALLAGVAISPRFIFAREKRNLAHEVRLYGLDGAPHAAAPVLRPPEFGDVSSISYDHHTDVLYVSLATFTAPSTLYAVDGKTLAWTRIFQDETAIDTAAIETKRVDIPSRDGKLIPAFISMRKGTVLDSNQPVLMNGYGGFNIGINVRYLGAMAALINRGVIFVDVGIRGGNEFGEAWHQDGMLAKKQNTFNDFVDAAQWLIDNKYTNPSKLAARGGSNGGLLMGAVAVQRPDLFKAIVCAVPLLDMLRFDKFLIARFWIPEYGDPAKRTDFNTLLTYSPYHNIRHGIELPAMMVIAGENDTRVDAVHAKKFVARAQANPAQQNPMLLKMDFDSGHGTGKSTQQTIDDSEVWMRFVLQQITG